MKKHQQNYSNFTFYKIDFSYFTICFTDNKNKLIEINLNDLKGKLSHYHDETLQDLLNNNEDLTEEHLKKSTISF